MKITENFKRAAKRCIERNGDMYVVVSKTQNWNVQALVSMGKLSTLIELPTGTVINSGSRGYFRRIEKDEIKYQSLMRLAK